MSTENLRRAAAAALAAIGGIHLMLAPEYFGEKAYVGVLFVAGGLAAVAAAVALWRDDNAPSWGSAA